MLFVSVVAVVAMLTGAAVIFNLEHSKSHANIYTLPDALWWAVGTISTVGTNAYPTTAAGRIVGALMMVTGVALAGIFTAAIATYFISSNDADHKPRSADIGAESSDLAQELAAMKVSIDRFHTELNQLRVLMTEITGRERYKSTATRPRTTSQRKTMPMGETMLFIADDANPKGEIELVVLVNALKGMGGLPRGRPEWRGEASGQGRRRHGLPPDELKVMEETRAAAGHCRTDDPGRPGDHRKRSPHEYDPIAALRVRQRTCQC
jgi:Ion channel